jgi:hypothetical protein
VLKKSSGYLTNSIFGGGTGLQAGEKFAAKKWALAPGIHSHRWILRIRKQKSRG